MCRDNATSGQVAWHQNFVMLQQGAGAGGSVVAQSGGAALPGAFNFTVQGCAGRGRGWVGERGQQDGLPGCTLQGVGGHAVE